MFVELVLMWKLSQVQLEQVFHFSIRGEVRSMGVGLRVAMTLIDQVIKPMLGWL